MAKLWSIKTLLLLVFGSIDKTSHKTWFMSSPVVAFRALVYHFFDMSLLKAFCVIALAFDLFLGSLII